MTMRNLVERYRPLVAVATPIAGIQLAQVALTTTDIVMMGSLSIKAVAAGGLAITLYNQLRTMCVGVVTAVGNLVAGAAGRGEARAGTDALDQSARAEVRRVVRASFLVATLVAVLAGIVFVAVSYALAWFGQDAELQATARPMMIALAPGLIPMLWLNVLRQFAVGMRRPGSLLGLTIVSIGVNAALDAALIHGWLGLPVLGLAGVGLATTFVQFLNFLGYLVIVRRDDRLAPLLSVRGWAAELSIVRTVVRLGVPISLTYGSEAGITSVATLMMGGFGPAALAAHTVVNQLAYIVYQLNIGISHGSSILISRAAGKTDPRQITQIARRALTLAAAAMTVVGVGYAALPTVVLRPFLGPAPDPEVLSIALTLLVFAVVHQFAKGTQNISVGLLRGLGNTTSGLTITLFAYWGIGVPAMLLFGYGLGFQGAGVWTGLCAGFATAAVLLLRRFQKDTALAARELLAT